MFRPLQALLLLAIFTLVGCSKGCSGRGGGGDAVLNSITIPLVSNLKGLDPVLSSDEYSNDVGGNIYEGLLQYNYLKRPLTPEPALADGMPTVSKDGLTHTFKIKKGVRFHDSEAFPEGKGREVVATDFIYSWKRLADTKTKSEGFWIFDGRIKGFNEWRDRLTKGEGKFDEAIEGLQAPDPHTLVITLNRPYYQLNYVLTMTYAGVHPREAVEKYGPEFLNHPVGTGPFRFVSWTRGNKVVLERNANWRGETYPTEGEAGDEEKGLLADAGKAIPFVDQLVFMEIVEDQPRWLNLMKGVLDIGAIPKDNFETVFDEQRNLKPDIVNKGMKLAVFSRSDVTYISFNMADPLFGKNRDLRIALSLAYDDRTAATKFYNNLVIPAFSPIAPDMDGWDPNYVNPNRLYNVEKAKEHLKKAGYPDGKGLPVLEYSTTGSTTARQMAEYLSQQFEQIGVKTKINMNSWPQFQERIRTRKAQMWGIAWSADYPDAENMFQLLYGKNVSPGPNAANFENKEFDSLYEQSQKLPPGPARTAIYLKMRDVFAREMPWITNNHRKGYTVYQGWLTNMKRNMTIKNYYKYLRVDEAKKKELKAKL